MSVLIRGETGDGCTEENSQLIVIRNNSSQ